MNGSSACKKVLKLSNIGITDWMNMVCNLLTGCLNEYIYQPLFSTRFLLGSFSKGSSSKLKLDRKYDSKESYCVSVLSKHFPRRNHLV